MALCLPLCLLCCLLCSSAYGLRHAAPLTRCHTSSTGLRPCMGGVEDVLKKGLLQGLEGSDALQRARGLSPLPSPDSDDGVWGRALLTNLARNDELTGKLESAGAILVSLSSDSYEGRSLLRNPRDDRYGMTGSPTDPLVSAVALGAVRFAVIAVPTGLEAQQVTRAVSWAGSTAVGIAVGGKYVFIVGSGATELLPLVGILLGDRVDIGALADTAGSESSVTFAVSKSPLAYPNSACEASVVTSMSVLSDALKKVAVPAASASSADILCCAAVRTASQLAGSDDFRRAAEEEKCCAPDSLEGRACVIFPCGVVCDEDDGYGSAEGGDIGDREGLPIGAMLHAPSGSLQSLLRLAVAFESTSRWSRELFAVSASREQAKDDLDDARESFGIFFTSTLIKYIGKRVAK